MHLSAVYGCPFASSGPAGSSKGTMSCSSPCHDLFSFCGGTSATVELNWQPGHYKRSRSCDHLDPPSRGQTGECLPVRSTGVLAIITRALTIMPASQVQLNLIFKRVNFLPLITSL